MTLSVFIGLSFALLLAVVGVTTFFLMRKPRVGFTILGVLLAIAVAAFVSWKPIYKTRTPRFAEDVKKVADPSDLQQWAVDMLRETPQAGSSHEIPKSRVPVGIRNLTSQGSSFQTAWCDPGSGKDRTVWLDWGGGFGHWGLRIGPPSFRVAPDSNYYIEWKPGIYFFHETK